MQMGHRCVPAAPHVDIYVSFFVTVITLANIALQRVVVGARSFDTAVMFVIVIYWR